MPYSFNRELNCTMTEAVTRVTDALKTEGFGVLTDIDVQATLKAKIDKSIPGYRILGACHPMTAFTAIGLEPRIGVMLPCNVLLREIKGVPVDTIEVCFVDPLATMASVKNDALGQIANEVHGKLKRISETL